MAEPALQTIRLECLSPHPFNPRLVARADVVDGIAAQIEDAGAFSPEHSLIVRPMGGDFFEIISGHHRAKAARQAGLEEVPCWVREMDDDEAHMALVLCNSQGELSPLEYGLHALTAVGRGAPGRGNVGGLSEYARKVGQTQPAITQKVHAAEVYEATKTINRVMDLLGRCTHLAAIHNAPKDAWEWLVGEMLAGEWSVERTEREVKDLKRKRKREEDRQIALIVEEKPWETVVPVQAGEWWRLGDHILFCGDSSSEEFKARIPDGIPFAFADPPYNVEAGEWDEGFSWRHDWLAEKANVAAVTPGIENFAAFFKSQTEMPYKWTYTCHITNGMTRGAVGFGNVILVLLFSAGSVHRGEQDFLAVSIMTGETEETTHRGRKPAELLVRLIEMYSASGETVVDPFLGSGTTLLVAQEKGRKCIGAELDPEFCTDIVRRWQYRAEAVAEKL